MREAIEQIRELSIRATVNEYTTHDLREKLNVLTDQIDAIAASYMGMIFFFVGFVLVMLMIRNDLKPEPKRTQRRTFRPLTRTWRP